MNGRSFYAPMTRSGPARKTRGPGFGCPKNIHYHDAKYQKKPPKSQ